MSVFSSFPQDWLKVNQTTTFKNLLSSLGLIQTFGCSFGRRNDVKMFIKKFAAFLYFVMALSLLSHVNQSRVLA